MKITKRQLRRIIREEKARLMEECPMGMTDDPAMPGPEPMDSGHDNHDHPAGMPCPIKTASKMKEAGASEQELMDFVATLIDEFRSGGTTGPDLPPKLAPSHDGPPGPAGGPGDLLGILGL